MDELDVSLKRLRILPVKEHPLIVLNCSYNFIEKLPKLPDTLQYLNCEMNHLYNLPKLPDLISLICNANRLTRLPKLPITLKTLECGSNQLTRLRLPTLEKLNCSKNNLSRLILPPSITSVYCGSNQLTSLKIPPKVEALGCNRNSLKSINIPDSLLHLECSNNRLTHITFNRALTYVNLSNNRIEKIPTLPVSILKLNIRHTDIHACFDIPDNLQGLFSYGSPLYHKVTCLLRIDNVSDPTILRQAFESIRRIEDRFRYTYYCLRLKEKYRAWLWRIREKIASTRYHPANLIEWLKDHDYDSLDLW